jgi:hypothetical protein
MKGGSDYEMTLGMDHYQLRCFYQTMAKAYRNWAGGEPYEQELLKQMRDEAWKLLLEAQFEG